MQLSVGPPPKKDAKKAVRDCINAGIKVKMITGDHEKTARAIAKDLGILTTGKVITGMELEKLSKEEYLKSLEKKQKTNKKQDVEKEKIVIDKEENIE